MPRKRYSPEQIITKLRQAEVELSRGLRSRELQHCCQSERHDKRSRFIVLMALSG